MIDNRENRGGAAVGLYMIFRKKRTFGNPMGGIERCRWLDVLRDIIMMTAGRRWWTKMLDRLKSVLGRLPQYSPDWCVRKTTLPIRSARRSAERIDIHPVRYLWSSPCLAWQQAGSATEIHTSAGNSLWRDTEAYPFDEPHLITALLSTNQKAAWSSNQAAFSAASTIGGATSWFVRRCTPPCVGSIPLCDNAVLFYARAWSHTANRR